MKTIYAVYGSGGYGREVMPLLRDYVNSISRTKNDQFYFIDDFAPKELVINNSKVFTFNTLIENFSNCNIQCCIAVADKETRKKLTHKCAENRIGLISIYSMNSIVMDNVKIGEGSIISPFVTITSNISIGKSFQANIYSYVAHDCIIGDFVTFAPAVKCNGHVHIGSGVYVGTGAIIHPGIKENPIVIGKNSLIAAGAVVTKNVPENVTVIGNPAQILSREVLRKMKNNG